MLAYVAATVGAVALTGIVCGGLLFGLHDATLLSGDTVPWWDGGVRTLGVCVLRLRRPGRAWRPWRCSSRR